MNDKDYKIETKPTFWVVTLSYGAYSDYNETDYYIRANDREEAWFLFKKFWDKEHNKDYYPCLRLNGDKRQILEDYVPSGAKKRRDEWLWDTSYGDAQDVWISNLDVIEFRR